MKVHILYPNHPHVSAHGVRVHLLEAKAARSCSCTQFSVLFPFFVLWDSDVLVVASIGSWNVTGPLPYINVMAGRQVYFAFHGASLNSLRVGGLVR